jgi:membrane-bound metal-dependent hydrolase YbcI (DUF457 family)
MSMPGIIPHAIAGCTLFIIGRFYFKHYFDGDENKHKRILLFIGCLFFTFIPDFFLAIYYTTHLFPRDVLMPYHILTSLALLPIAIGGLIIFTLSNTKYKPIWIMGMLAILVHITMDMIIQNETLLF